MVKSSKSGVSSSTGTQKSQFDQQTEQIKSWISSSLSYLRDSEQELRDALENFSGWDSDYDEALQYHEFVFSSGSSDDEKEEAEHRLRASKRDYDNALERLKEARADYLGDIKDYDMNVADLNEHLGRKEVGYYHPSEELVWELEHVRGWKTYHRKHRWS